jgi:hypothetical protein
MTVSLNHQKNSNDKLVDIEYGLTRFRQPGLFVALASNLETLFSKLMAIALGVNDCYTW